jgi:F-type H+-transporting ATPase subunit alpha
MKRVSSSLKLELAQYHEMLTFAQFGSDLDASTKKIIEHGAKLTELLKQPQYRPMEMVKQVLSLFAAKNGFLDKVEVADVQRFEAGMHRYFTENRADLVNKINETGEIDSDLQKELRSAMEEALKQFLLVKGVQS